MFNCVLCTGVEGKSGLMTSFPNEYMHSTITCMLIIIKAMCVSISVRQIFPICW